MPVIVRRLYHRPRAGCDFLAVGTAAVSLAAWLLVGFPAVALFPKLQTLKAIATISVGTLLGTTAFGVLYGADAVRRRGWQLVDWRLIFEMDVVVLWSIAVFIAVLALAAYPRVLKRLLQPSVPPPRLPGLGSLGDSR